MGQQTSKSHSSWQFSNTLQSPLLLVLRVRLGEMWIDNLTLSCYKTYLNMIIKFFFKFDLNASCYYFYFNFSFFTSIANLKESILDRATFFNKNPQGHINHPLPPFMLHEHHVKLYIKVKLAQSSLSDHLFSHFFFHLPH